MKRNSRHKFGEVRSDGCVFRGYEKYTLKNGEVREREKWASPKAWARQMAYEKSRRGSHRSYVKEHYKKHRKKYVQRSRKWYTENKERAYETKRAYAVKNKEKTAAWRRAHYQQNREKNAEQVKRWIKRNKRRFVDNRRRYIKNRYKNDVQFRLGMLLRSRLLTALKGRKKAASVMKMVGCSLDELVAHLEAQFTKTMNWDNHGTSWHIDHIIPLVAFDLTQADHQRAACNYLNLRPLDARRNLQKGGRITEEQRADIENFVFLINNVI
jgi:hypothetical protein